MRVVAIVVSYNSAQDLPACLAALDTQDHDNFEVVVVDNASSDDSLALARQAAERDRTHPLTVLASRTNRGFAGAINDVLARLPDSVDAVLFANPDAMAAPTMVSRAVAVMRTDERIGSVQPRLSRPVAENAEPGTVEADALESGAVIDTTGHVLTSARLFNNRGENQPADVFHPAAGEVFGVSGALALHRRAMLDDIAWRRKDGRYEALTEDLFAYFDDVELDWRARILGWRAVYEPTATGAHERGGAGPRRTPFVEALNWSNRLVVLATCDVLNHRRSDLPVIAATTVLKTAELALTVPKAVPTALHRLRYLPVARIRRRQLLARARVDFTEVLDTYVAPFRWRPWVATWWRRTKRRAARFLPSQLRGRQP